MAISQATPEEGLTTGALEGASGGLGADSRRKIAEQYEPDLSGKNGPLARFDATLELIANEIDLFAGSITFTSGDGTQIFGQNGKFAIQAAPPTKKGGGVAPFAASRSTLRPWDLIVTSADDGEVVVNIGTIIKDASDLETELTITSGTDTFAPAGGDFLYLKLANLGTPTATMTLGGAWTDHPAAYEVTSSGATAAYTAYYYPLHHFRSTTADGYSRINDNLFYLKLAGIDHFLLTHGIYQTGTDQPLVVHRLVPHHRALP